MIPESVKAAAERAEALIKAQGTPPEDGNKPEQDTPTPEATDQKPATQDDQADDFEAKYKTLQGKYNAEIPRLNQQIRTLQEQLQALEEQTNNQGPDEPDYTIDPESLSEYGEEFGTLAKQINQLAAENKTLKEQLGTVEKTQGETAYEWYINSVAMKLKENGKDFNKMNSDPDFLTWLQEVHPFTGRPRHESLQAAERAMDVGQTMRIFKEYLGTANPTQEAKPPPNVQPSYNNPGSDTKPPIPGSQGRIWTRADIQKLYKDKTAGLYRGKDAEFKAIEADMFAAQREGRIR